MISTASTPHFLQGNEPYPTEKLITHFANRARNGAAAVTINHMNVVAHDEFNIPGGPDPLGLGFANVPGHFLQMDLKDFSCQNYLCQMIDAVHFYGAKAVAYLAFPDRAPGLAPPSPDTVTEEMLDRYVDSLVEQALAVKKLGFDMVSAHCAYRGMLPAQFLSPLTNKRSDRYGGSMENRARLALRIFRGIKEACGEGFPIEAVISGSEPAGGNTVDDVIAFARLAEGAVDILTVRAGEIDPQHPTGFTSTPADPTPFLEAAAAVKESGTRIKVAASAGFQDLAWNERAIASGKADLIGMARSWIADSEYGQKAYEGRGEDVVPCIRCNKCHVSNAVDMFRSACSVNPLVGIEDKVERMITAPVRVKNVAVVGGGPAGMEAALVAARRGHNVTLFEKSDALGGQLKHADWASFKWPLKNFKDYMIRQLYKEGVDVMLDTAATKDMLGGYDAVAVAVGSRPAVPDLPGVDGENVVFAPDVFGNEASLAGNVVVVGGGEIGVETAMHLAENGHRVTVLEVLPQLAADAPLAHYRSMLEAAWEKLAGFAFVVNARCTGIDRGGVAYVDTGGAEHRIEAGSVVLAVGSRPKHDEAIALFGPGGVAYMIGDCDTVGNVQKAMRSAFAAASLI